MIKDSLRVANLQLKLPNWETQKYASPTKMGRDEINARRIYLPAPSIVPGNAYIALLY